MPAAILPEIVAARRAIVERENNRVEAALDLLRAALSGREIPPGKPDTRSGNILLLRANIERAIRELTDERAYHEDAVETLRKAVAPRPTTT
jgi:hypothetical protein